MNTDDSSLLSHFETVYNIVMSRVTRASIASEQVIYFAIGAY